MASAVTRSTQEYYDNDDVDRFYHAIWGGETISIGIYDDPSVDIRTASMRTIERLADLAGPPKPASRILDLGAGYGGSARYLAKTYGCHVTCLNLSPTQNERNKQICAEQNLTHFIDVFQGSFEDVPLSDHTFDVIWSQDALLHSSNRVKVLNEISRLLVETGGVVVLTDIMQRPDITDPALLESYMQRLPVDHLATIEWYKAQMSALGFTNITSLNLTQHLATHYESVLTAFEKHEHHFISESRNPTHAREYVERSKRGLASAAQLAKNADLEWGILVFKR